MRSPEPEPEPLGPSPNKFRSPVRLYITTDDILALLSGHSHQKTYSSCTARFRVSFVLAVQLGTHLPCLVRTFVCSYGTCWMRAVRLLGGAGEETCHGWPRRTCARHSILFNLYSHILYRPLWKPKMVKPIGGALKGHSEWITSLSWELPNMSVP
jgi:hypothetical protein